jgi:acyl-Coa thioesterase superfamily protein
MGQDRLHDAPDTEAGRQADAAPGAVFVQHGDGFLATELARGPWDPQAQHGGAPAALLMRAFEQLPAADGLQVSRVTYEFLRPAPLGELEVTAEVVRPGRRVQLSEASMSAAGVEVVRARALQIQRADPGATRTPPGPPPGPEYGSENDFRPPHRPMFSPDAIEIRFVTGTFNGGGPASAWFRLRREIVAGEETSPLQRLAAAGDFGNGISSTLSWDEYLFINPDLTLYVDREPVGEWICLEAQTIISPDGAGTAESVLYDTRGRVGRAIQALLVARR